MLSWIFIVLLLIHWRRGRRGRVRVVVGFTTTFAISAYHHWCCEFESRSDEVFSIQHYVIKNWQWLAAGRWFSPGTVIFSIIKTDLHDLSMLDQRTLKLLQKIKILTQISRFFFYRVLYQAQYKRKCTSSSTQGRLNGIIGLRAGQCTGAPAYATTHRNKINVSNR